MSRKADSVSDEYLRILEEIKKQYEQYLEVSGLYELPTRLEPHSPEFEPPSLEHPLTTNTVSVQ